MVRSLADRTFQLRFGSGGELPAEQLAAMPGGVVVVTVNYRLGPFGFLMAPGRGGPARRGTYVKIIYKII